MYSERFINYKKQTLFNLERINDQQVLVVFFHGIGDSHLNYTDFFEVPQLQNYDLLIADLLGYGRSSDAENYSFSEQVDALVIQLKQHVDNYKKIIFVPHSMGGIHATLLAKNQFAGKINGIYAVETTVTQFGSFIAHQIHQVVTKDAMFDDWFVQFSDKIYIQMGMNNNIIRKFYAGLQFLRKDAFLDNAKEMYNLSLALKQLEFTNKIGLEFVELPIPKVYCLGEKGAQLQSIPFLQQNNIAIEYFPTDIHWVAQTCIQDFCNRLQKFIENI